MSNKETLKNLFQNFWIGNKNSVKIEKIERELRVDNRTARILVNRLRIEDNMPIISLSLGRIKGYFLYRDDTDRHYAIHFLKETKSRIREIAKILRPVEKVLADKSGQLLMAI